ncbi:hypothetical protein [Streptomyces coeruleorubidus]|uniref:Uncharacterized protein n=1 Tax=Streptomyces coeruleorubidus TaxID=116188 RepID=A0A5J6IK14_STRC4|nr:hypothetical protein [Streptomyces coeruleorubidus]QEV28935.1 hypothetical protein CP976_35655 [Streptomyces coeruleorubidus]GGU11671.1 hypothetical protein GCM10010256_83880 [Streptomyces coeruleorubidus]
MTPLTSEKDPAPWPTDTTPDLLARISQARAKGVTWLRDRIADDGRPEGAETANSWWRAPWALCVGGAPEAAAAMMGWAEREALTDEGDLRPGPHDVPGGSSPVYHLSALAICAWLLARYDTATAIDTTLRRFQNPDTGGAYDLRDFAEDPLEDNLKTAQLGFSALVTGDRHTAGGVHRWLKRNLAEQPELPKRLFTGRRGHTLVTDFPPETAFQRVVDFQSPGRRTSTPASPPHSSPDTHSRTATRPRSNSAATTSPLGPAAPRSSTATRRRCRSASSAGAPPCSPPTRTVDISHGWRGWASGPYDGSVPTGHGRRPRS